VLYLSLDQDEEEEEEEGGQTDGIAAGLQALAAGPAAASLETVNIHPKKLLGLSEVQQLFTAAFRRLYSVTLDCVVVADDGARPASPAAAVEAVKRELEALGLQVESCNVGLPSRSRLASGSGQAVVDVVVARPGALSVEAELFVNLLAGASS
jgi:hypothetical protein